MRLTVAVMNSKGGCGKTTAATHIAAGLAVSGLAVALADCDRQKSARLWGKLRPGKAAAVAMLDWRDDFGNCPKGIQRLIVDTPASIPFPRARRVIREADAIVVPLLPSVFDEAATLRFLGRIEALKPLRRGDKPVLLLANRVGPRGPNGADLEAFLAGHGYRLAASIPDRALYPQLAAKGSSVFDLESKSAFAEQKHWLPLLQAIEAVAGAKPAD